MKQVLEGLDWVIRTLYTTTALVVIELFCPSGLIASASDYSRVALKHPSSRGAIGHPAERGIQQAKPGFTAHLETEPLDIDSNITTTQPLIKTAYTSHFPSLPIRLHPFNPDS
ncbi:predicted protein [Histoplasma capsulatum G186AR]|uniref:Uncharacterized protein n=2 Tax=Ajellomyces capsulatus TaxID=5037 RepID=C0NEJ2_AJECG|nr:uncharacterized protein HCBG_01308 [Histoplasma capsulatum G186AR]EEH09663.1 predicted protein [Histoplasma capsulatum G186AR]